MRKIKIPVQELCLKIWGAYTRRGAYMWNNVVYLPMNVETVFHCPIQSPHCALTSNTEVVSGVRPESLLSTMLVVKQSRISKQFPLFGLKQMWYLVTSDQGH